MLRELAAGARVTALDLARGFARDRVVAVAKLCPRGRACALHRPLLVQALAVELALQTLDSFPLFCELVDRGAALQLVAV